MKPQPITNRLPTEADAVKPFGFVMVLLGKWGWQNVYWREVKAGQGWAQGVVQPPLPKPQPRPMGAWH